MSFDTLGRYDPNHKAYDQIGNIIPVVDYSEGDRPHGEWWPACWLPVQFFEKYFSEWMVCMPGKALALDNDSKLVPAQYGLGSASITYAANDVEAGVIDVRTGSALLTANIGTFLVSAVTSFMGRGLGALAVSKPIGVAPYPFWKWAGDASSYDDGTNPAGYMRHNFNLQHRAGVLCDYVIELPLVPALSSVGTDIIQSSRDASTNIALLTDAGSFTGLLPMAKNTMRTPITITGGDASTRFAVEKDAMADITQMGDYYVDLVNGYFYCYASADVLGHYDVNFYHYGSAPTGTNVSKFACALGDLTPGCFVKCNSDSNFVVATAKTYGDAETDNFDTFADILGQVIEREDVLGKDALDRVRTAYPSLSTDAAGSLPAYAGQMDQMPGSATGGAPGNVHYAGGANLVVRINLISR